MTSGGDSYQLPAVPDAIAVARAIVDEAVAHLPMAVRDDAALLVSELMSNVVRHGGTTADLTVSLSDGHLVVAVHDEGTGRPTMRTGALDPTVASGRGLRIVDKVAVQWGVEDDRRGGGKTVWFRLAVEESARCAQDREDRTVWS